MGGVDSCWLVGGANGSTGVFKAGDPGMIEVQSVVIGSVERPLYVGSIAMQSGWAGVAGGVSIGYGGTYFTINGHVFNTSVDFGSIIDAHAVYSLGNHSYAAVGINAEIGMGPAISTNGGLTFTPRWWPEGFTVNFYPRYGAFPEGNTWYIAGGAYPGMMSNAAGTAESYDFYGGSKQHPAISTNYSAVITKTEDGGVTWLTLLTDYGRFYFNEISCWDVSNCIAIGEGNGTVYIYRTSNGMDWGPVFQQGNNSYYNTGTCIRAVISNDGNFSGWAAVSSLLETVFLYTSDGGATWVKSSSVPSVKAIVGMTLFNGQGYAAGLTTTGASTIIGLNTPPNPSPQPVPYGFHLEKVCPNGNCTSCRTTRSTPTTCVASSPHNATPNATESYTISCTSPTSFVLTQYPDKKCKVAPKSAVTYPSQTCIHNVTKDIGFLSVSCPGNPAV
eukprot:TRINITY_DN42073_c0_g1_i1.p1 TRINITY_DN42073_c0_g1~~TRINITY_DN42073_c0_g1_i1.p1  ORF type:complete len:469 (+),score=16.08 TRINITY_DN42073_c0_g1_i1:73-1407(+)